MSDDEVCDIFMLKFLIVIRAEVPIFGEEFANAVQKADKGLDLRAVQPPVQQPPEPLIAV